MGILRTRFLCVMLLCAKQRLHCYYRCCLTCERCRPARASTIPVRLPYAIAPPLCRTHPLCWIPACAVDESDVRLLTMLSGRRGVFKMRVHKDFWSWGGMTPDRDWFEGEWRQEDGWNPKSARMAMVLWEDAERRTKHHMSELLAETARMTIEKVKGPEEGDEDFEGARMKMATATATELLSFSATKTTRRMHSNLATKLRIVQRTRLHRRRPR